MENQKHIQKIQVPNKDNLGLALTYYSLLSSIAGAKLTRRDIQLLAFTAVKGNISYSDNRKEFCSTYNSSSPTINNIVFKLKKLGLLVKDGGKIKVNPKYLLQFDKDIILQISLVHG